MTSIIISCEYLGVVVLLRKISIVFYGCRLIDISFQLNDNNNQSIMAPKYFYLLKYYGATIYF